MRVQYFFKLSFLFCIIASCKYKQNTEIFIVNNDLRSIPDSVFEKRNLTTLSISQEGFTIYPPLSSLDSDSTFKMPLNELPEILGNLTELEFLRISGSNIKKLPSSFSKLNNIEKLDLSMNPNLKIVNELEKLKKLPKLHYLNIFGTDFSDKDLQTLKDAFGNKVKIIATLKDFLEELPESTSANKSFAKPGRTIASVVFSANPSFGFPG